jgi:hypothetical protein
MTKDEKESAIAPMIQVLMSQATTAVMDKGFPIEKATATLRYCQKVFDGSPPEMLFRIETEDISRLLDRAGEGYDRFVNARRNPFGKFGPKRNRAK